MHTWFIGDIHGCLEELELLEEKARRTSERSGAEAFFVSVGDLVDRGPDSAGVVQHLRRGVAAGTHAAILGNHEEMMLRALFDTVPERFDDIGFSPWVSVGDDYRDARPGGLWLSTGDLRMLNRLTWLAQGGAETLLSWDADPVDPDTWDIPEEDLQFLCELPVVYADERVVATHALARSTDLEALLDGSAGPAEVQRALWLRSLPRSAPEPERIHVSGHTPLKRVRRYRDRQLVRLDTGCCYGRRLSAWCAELDRVVSVAAD